MKHGVRIWQSKLNKKPSHRASLLANMVGQLINHEQITTTVAKAKVLRHEIDEVINLAKNGSVQDWELVKQKVNDQQNTIPKLKYLIANRYKHLRGGYVRVLRKGFNAPGSDRAPLAMIELVNNPNDIVYHLARNNIRKLKEDLSKVEDQRYEKKMVKVIDPVTKKDVVLTQLIPLQLPIKLDLKLKRKEIAIHKKLVQFNNAIESYPQFRQLDEEALKKIKKLELSDKVDGKLENTENIHPEKMVPQHKYKVGKVTKEVKKINKSEEMVAKEAENPNESDFGEKKDVPKSFFKRFFGFR